MKIEKTISQRQVKIEQRSIAHFSPRFMGFLHASTCWFSCVDETLLFAAQSGRKKNWFFFVIFLSNITSEPDTAGSWKRGKHAKWFVPWKIWPGVAPCAGHFQKNGEIRQRQNLKNEKMGRKRQIFQRLFVLETSQTPVWTPRQVPNNFAI